MTLLFISHDVRAVAALCTSVGVMQAGRLVEQGPVLDVLRTPQADYTRKLLSASRMDRRPASAKTSGETLFVADKVSRIYAQGGFLLRRSPPVPAIDKVSLELGVGECVAVVGPSGCGKTTLARMIVGLDSASEGQMRFEGEPYHGRNLPPRLRAGLSLVFQDPFSSFDPRLTVGQSMAEPLRLLGAMPPPDRDMRLRTAIEAVGLEATMLSRYPHEFSGGQRQRIAIARALVTRPRLIVLDEPVASLDVIARGEVLVLLNRLRADFGLTFLVISHDLDMLRVVADRVIVIDKGKIVETGTPAQLLEKPQQAVTRDLIAAGLPEVGIVPVL